MLDTKSQRLSRSMSQGMYQEIILDHYKRPKGRGLRDPFDAEVHHVNPTCGDEVTVRVRLAGAAEPSSAEPSSDGGGGRTVEDVSYEGVGCSISQASASVLHELLVGRPVDEAMSVHDAFTELVGGRGQVEPDEDVLGDGIAFAGVAKYPARVKCALLAWMAFKDATARAVEGGEGS
jgi:nitrogen fixation NifU-like protein